MGAKEIEIPIGVKGSERLDKFMQETVLAMYPQAKLIVKRTSVLMWVLYCVGFMWIWQKRFMEGYATAVGYKVYPSTRTTRDSGWDQFYKTMRHEFIHFRQKHRYGIVYDISYLFPQVLFPLSLVALLAIWLSSWWLMWLVFLVFLAPFPAPYRKRWEMEGYTATMVSEFEDTGGISDYTMDRIERQFTSANYYFMWPFPKRIRAEIRAIADGIRSGVISGKFLSYP